MTQSAPPEEPNASDGRSESQTESQTDAPFDPVGHNIATVAELRAQAEQQIDRHQRAAENITAWLGHARFLYLLIFIMSAWVLYNVLARRMGQSPFDPPPFNLLISLVNVSALLISSVVLISQNRQGKSALRREHLDLQINMLNDQRTAKIIALLEELRHDMPSVKNRVDLEAEALSTTINPADVLKALENTLEQPHAAGAFPPGAAESAAEPAEAAICEAIITQEQQSAAKK